MAGHHHRQFAPIHQPPGWYLSPEDQLANVRRWNDERSWGFTDSDFPSQIPDFTPNQPLEVLVLAVYLPDEGN